MDLTVPASSPEHLFLSVIDDQPNGLDAEVSSRLFRYFLTQGLDPTREVDEAGRNVIEAWWSKGRGAYRKGPLAEDVAEWAARYPQLWTHTSGTDARRRSTRSPLRRTLGQQVLEDLATTDRTGSVHTLAEWIRVLPLPELALHQPWEGGNPSKEPGAALFRYALSLHRDAAEGSAAAVDALLARGLPFRDKEVGFALNTTAQWVRFLEGGGNPDAEVRDHDNKPQPLWKALRARAPDGCAQAINAWAQQNRGKSLAQEQVREYWRDLDRNHTAADIQKKARARADWPSVTAPDGRTVLMQVAALNASAFQSLAKTAKAWAPPANASAEDRWGRTLWAYAWGHNHLDSTAATLLLDQNVPLGPNKTGDGLLQQCLLRGDKPFSQHELARTIPPSWVERACKRLGAEALSHALWGTPEAMAELGDWVRLEKEAYWGSAGRGLVDGPSQLIHLLAHLAAKAPPLDPPPSLRGALAWACFASGRRNNHDGHRTGLRYLEEGPADTLLSPEHQVLARGWVSEEEQVHLNAAQLQVHLPASAPARARARM